MSKQMKLLMENFNKFIEEEEMEMESDDSSLDAIIDDILGGMLQEGILKEMFPTSEDAEEGDEIMSEPLPSKEEIKSDIKKVVKAPEVKAVLDRMSEEALKNQDIEAGLKYAISSYADDFKLAAASVPGLSIMGAVLGSFNEPANALFMDPAVLEPIIAGNMKFGAAIGAVIGAAFLAKVAVDFFKDAEKVRKSREDARKSI